MRSFYIKIDFWIKLIYDLSNSLIGTFDKSDYQ